MHAMKTRLGYSWDCAFADVEIHNSLSSRILVNNCSVPLHLPRLADDN